MDNSATSVAQEPLALFDFGVEETTPNKFEAPDEIVQTVSGARSIYMTLRTSHLKRIQLYAQILGLFQGNAPYDAQELASAGLSHIANFNDMSAMAVLNRVCLMYWNLLYNTSSIIHFTIHSDDPEAPFYAQMMSDAWKETIERYWPDFRTNYASLTTQLAQVGVSPAFFPDEKDPRWRMAEMSRFFIPNEAQTDTELLTTICIESDFTPQQLWAIYQEYKDKDKDETPWDLKEIGALLASQATFPDSTQNGPFDWFQLEQKILNRDYTLDQLYNASLKIVSLYQREYSGKISHYMFHRYFDDGGFLFQEQDQYSTFSEAFVIFTMNPGQYTIHGNRGIGHQIFSLSQAKIRQDCSTLDLSKWASSPMLKSPSLSTRDTDQIRFIPGVPINLGQYEFIQNNLGANVQGGIAMAQYLTSLIQSNINYSGSDPAQPDADQGSLSPTQVKFQASREFSTLKNIVLHFYANFDILLQSMVGKMWNSKEGYPGHELTKKWKEACARRRVPPEIFEDKSDKDKFGLPGNIWVRAARALGAGSQAAQISNLGLLSNIAGSFNAQQQRSYQEDWIIATVGPENLSRYMQGTEDPDEISGGASLAGQENNGMRGGMSAIFSLSNEHRAHAGVHMSLATQIIQQVSQQQMSPIDADKVFNNLIPHLGEHINALANNPLAQSFFQQIRGPWDQVQRFATLNRNNAQKMLQAQIRQQQQQAQQQTEVMNDEQLKTMQTMNDERRKDIKLEAQSKRQEAAGSAKEKALARKTEGDLAIKTREAEGKLEIERRKAQGEQTIDASKQLADMQGSTPSPSDFEGPSTEL